MDSRSRLRAQKLTPSLHTRTGLEQGWEKSLQNHLSAHLKNKQGRAICFGKLLPPFCKVCVAPARCRERKREGKGWREPKGLPAWRTTRFRPADLRAEHQEKQVGSFSRCLESADASPLLLGASHEPGVTDEPLSPSCSPSPCALSLRTRDKTHRYTKHDVTQQSRCVIKA